MTRSLHNIALVGLLAMMGWLLPAPVAAQLSSNPDKFLGNITTSYQVDFGNEKFYQLWNQITPENESKWSSIEGGARGSFNWGGCDNAYNYAKNHNFPFKFHCLIWGAQYPGWLDRLSTSEQYKAIVEWMDAIKKRYPDLALIDVVNEAVAGHQPAPYKEALGGDGQTGYDWIIKAFEMAHERWPNAILIYNDYNTFRWQTTQFIELVKTLRDAGAPIDAYGCQSHDLTDLDFNSFKSVMKQIQDSLRIPMYSTEYDIGTFDDNLQEQRFKEQIPYMWEADYCAGITLWGYIYGRTWTTDGNSGIIRDGADRPAMTWLRTYMKSDKAKNAKSPFPGMKKEASVYVKPASLSATKGEALPITVRARLRTKTIDHVDFYVNDTRVTTMTAAPYETTYTPAKVGKHKLKAVVVATDGSQYERLSSFTAYNPRTPYKNDIALPGTLQAENFDSGADGIAFHDSDGRNEGVSYRSNGGGVDIVSTSSGYAIGYTVAGEWLEYSVNVAETGIYSFDAYVSSESGGGSFNLLLNENGTLTSLTGSVDVPKTNSYSTYKAVHGRTNVQLEAGKHILRLRIDKANFNIDRIVFKRIEVDNNINITLTADPAPATINTSTTLKVTASSTTSDIANVKIYVENVQLKSLNAAPFETTYRPTAKGECHLMAIATDADGKQSKMAKYTLTVNNKRTAYKKINLPGVIEAENFDKGGEGFTFHDSDAEDEGQTNYRTDNEGVDIVTGNNGYALGYTVANEWTEYSVNVVEPGRYSYEATVSSGVSGSSFTIGLVKDGKVTTLSKVTVPQTGNNSWDTYKVVKGTFVKYLEEGSQILRITINGANCNIDKLDLKCTLNTGIELTTMDKEQGKAPVVYDLHGRRFSVPSVSSLNAVLPKGIYIVNGKKVYVK